jgi:hypothetical protein
MEVAKWGVTAIGTCRFRDPGFAVLRIIVFSSLACLTIHAHFVHLSPGNIMVDCGTHLISSTCLHALKKVAAVCVILF